jgi:hypothetical protein
MLLPPEQSIRSRAMCDARFFMWPDMPKCKGKRLTEREPLAKLAEKYGENIAL